MSDQLSIEQAGNILLIGVTGGTGHQAVRGLIAQGFTQLKALTRDQNKPSSENLKKLGVELISGDLDDETSLKAAMQNIDAIYLHGTTADVTQADNSEVPRAKRLASIAKDAGIKHLVYNSVDGGEREPGVPHMVFKYEVEKALNAAGVPSTMLRATLFMEEWWKHHNRPDILKGHFRVAQQTDFVHQMIAVRDMGWIAGKVLRNPERYIGQAIPVATDSLSVAQMCDAFSASQASAVEHQQLPIQIFSAPGMEQFLALINWFNNDGHQANVDTIQQDFPGTWRFADFLRESNWGNTALTYDSFSDGSHES